MDWNVSKSALDPSTYLSKVAEPNRKDSRDDTEPCEKCIMYIIVPLWTMTEKRVVVKISQNAPHSYISFSSVPRYAFLADRTNGRAIATLLRLSVCPLSSSVTLCIVAKRCVVEQKLLLRAYRKSYMRNRLVPKSVTLTFV